MKIETIDPGVDAVRESVRVYIDEYPDFAEALGLYGKIMVAQQEALESIECRMEALDEGVVEAKLVLGDTLMEPGDLPIDGPIYRELVSKICRAVNEATEDGLQICQELPDWEGLSDDMVGHTRDLLLAGEDLGFLAERKLSEDDEELVKNILWEGLAPFYRSCGRILTVNMEQAFWQKPSCPVCGAAPLMGKYREGDGLWLVECSLCHTLWNLQRAACPFCDESQGSLGFVHLEGDISHRANYCKVCRRYIKTVDLRSGEGTVLLPLEDIVTIDVDVAAKSEGLTPASGSRNVD